MNGGQHASARRGVLCPDPDLPRDLDTDTAERGAELLRGVQRGAALEARAYEAAVEGKRAELTLEVRAGCESRGDRPASGVEVRLIPFDRAAHRGDPGGLDE